MEKTILLAHRTCVDLYPPVLHQSSILAERYNVIVLDAPRAADPNAILTEAKVIRVRVSEPVGRYGLAVRRRFWIAEYATTLWRLLLRRPAAVIAYDEDAAAMMLSLRSYFPTIPLVVHLHELLLDLPQTPLRQKFTMRYVQRRLRRADLVVTADRYRARFSKKRSALDRLPVVVMNCPRRLVNPPVPKLDALLEFRGIRNKRVVYYQGAVAASRSIETVIASIKHWPADAVFVVVGKANVEFLRTLKSLAARNGASEKVVFLGQVGYDRVLGLAAGATVGMSVINPTYPNWRWSAGASNKRFEYIALGIPQVTNNGPGIQALFERPGVATVADAADPVSVALCVNRYLGNPELCREVRERARKLHLAEYNYEHQFMPVMAWLERRIHLTIGDTANLKGLKGTN